ncbi:MAG: matrixin family metalloprotease [Candidatus Obscuribacterales bacterium]|nr:matrixin family metalloprotease [Candidatus Obscuribacterales bacterium]
MTRVTAAAFVIATLAFSITASFSQDHPSRSNALENQGSTTANTDPTPTFVTSKEALAAYQNANKLFNDGKVDAAAAQCVAALKIDPSFSPCIARLADCYYVRGQYAFAKQCYTDFLKRSPLSRSAQHCRERILMCDQEQRKATLSYANSSNYLNEVQSDWAKCTWPEGKMPLKVYIYPTNGSAGFHYGTVFQQALDQWVGVLDHRLTYRMVQTPGEANITCQWTQQCRDPNHQGETNLLYKDNHDGTAPLEVARITIAVNTPNGPVSAKVLKSTCLHEIGHALGLHGHSTNKNDTMYYAVSKFAPAQLTSRDINTINHLYNGYTKHYP